jgi:hypothetical protein
MPYLHNYRLFISHAWAYSEGYTRVLKFLTDAPHFIFSNYSVPVAKAFDTMTKLQLQEQLREQIRPVQAVVILGGMYVAHSDWIQFEIDFAVSLKKPILGITPWAAQRMPDAVTRAATKIVGWNTTSIVDGIRGLVD